MADARLWGQNDKEIPRKVIVVNSCQQSSYQGNSKGEKKKIKSVFGLISYGAVSCHLSSILSVIILFLLGSRGWKIVTEKADLRLKWCNTRKRIWLAEDMTVKASVAGGSEMSWLIVTSGGRRSPLFSHEEAQKRVHCSCSHSKKVKKQLIKSHWGGNLSSLHGWQNRSKQNTIKTNDLICHETLALKRTPWCVSLSSYRGSTETLRG